MLLHSLNMFSTDTDLVNPVTRRAASFWIFCKVCESCSEHPSYTTESISTNKLFSLRIIPRILVADRTMI